jgi:hypothetical protein
MKTCISCKFHKKAPWFSLHKDLCTHPKCVDKGFVYTDKVTGEVSVYDDQPKDCWSARLRPCGEKAKYWEPK